MHDQCRQPSTATEPQGLHPPAVQQITVIHRDLSSAANEQVAGRPQLRGCKRTTLPIVSDPARVCTATATRRLASAPQLTAVPNHTPLAQTIYRMSNIQRNAKISGNNTQERVYVTVGPPLKTIYPG